MFGDLAKALKSGGADGLNKMLATMEEMKSDNSALMNVKKDEDGQDMYDFTNLAGTPPPTPAPPPPPPVPTPVVAPPPSGRPGVVGADRSGFLRSPGGTAGTVASPVPMAPTMAFPAQNFPAQSFQNFPAQSFPAQSFPVQSFPAQNFPAQAQFASPFSAAFPSAQPLGGLSDIERGLEAVRSNVDTLISETMGMPSTAAGDTTVGSDNVNQRLVALEAQYKDAQSAMAGQAQRLKKVEDEERAEEKKIDAVEHENKDMREELKKNRSAKQSAKQSSFIATQASSQSAVTASSSTSTARGGGAHAAQHRRQQQHKGHHKAAGGKKHRGAARHGKKRPRGSSNLRAAAAPQE